VKSRSGLSWLDVSEKERMNTDQVEVTGTVRPDGSLQLDQAPNMSPGPVTVVLRRERQTGTGQPLSGLFFQMMDDIWAGQHARGFAPRTNDDIQDERDRLEVEAEAEIEAAVRLQEESRRLRAKAEGEGQSS
jgi:hypothetical protein